MSQADQQHQDQEILDGHYIKKDGLQGLKHYKYCGEDLSIIASKLGQPFWRASVNFLPYWLAPNLITLIGLAGVMASYLVLSTHIPIFDQQPTHPSQIENLLFGIIPFNQTAFVYTLTAFLLFVYQTLDALDGKQARRTETSSPLGELFDHGCDAVTGTFLCLNLLTAMHVPTGSIMSFVGILNVILPFYMAQWEEYHTGTLVLGYINVTEAQIVSIIVFMVSATFGARLWTQPLFDLDWFGEIIPVPASMIVFGTGFVGGIWNMVVPFFKVTRHHLRTGSIRQLLNSYSHLLPLIILTIVSAVWIRFSPTDILARHPHSLIILIGFLNSSLVGRVILARVCGQLPVDRFPLVLFPSVAASFFVYYFPSLIAPYESLILFSCMLSSIFSYLVFAYLVTQDLCRYLKINALTMTEAQRQAAFQLVHGEKIE